MFACLARVTLEIPASGSLKAKRQVLRRITDRVKARFNISVAEVDDQDLWQRAMIAMAVVGSDRRHVNEQMDKVIQFIDDMYVAPIVTREMEILSFGDQLFAEPEEEGGLNVSSGQRSLAEAEGLGEWELRHQKPSHDNAGVSPGPRNSTAKKMSLDEARARARTLRNRREWEKK